MSKSCLNLLGGFELRSAGGAPVRLPTRKSEALLAYLALAPASTHARDSLTALLWGDTSEQNARASLRQTLSLLGKALPPGALDANARSVALAPGMLVIDVAEFDECTTRGSAEALERAAAIYRGELLAGLAVSEPSFEDWLLAERERLRERAIDVFARLVTVHSERGESDRAIQAALRLSALDPLEEIAHRALMRLYLDQGRRAAALRQYQICLNVLRRELGAEPEPETKSLYNELLRRQQTAAPSPLSEMPIHASPLFGRDVELAGVVGSPQEAGSNRGRIVAILGEAGIGKTRLTEELATRAVLGGMRVLVGRCYESQQQFPFGPWVEMLRASGVLADRELLEKLDAPWRSELARILPELAAAPQEAGEEGLARRGQLFEALVRLVAQLAERRRLLLVLEDLHWADEMSLRLLAILGRRAPAWPIMVAVTAREEELPGMPALRRTLEELAGSGVLTRIDLAPLSQADTAALVRALARAGADERLVERLCDRVWRASEGNPFVVIESMRSLGQDAARGAEIALLLPERVRDVIAGHIERLSPRARQMVSVAAVAGREFDFALLQRAGAQSELEASAALEELVRRQVLHAVGERFDFVHDRVRQVVDDALLAPARRILHVALAEALEALFASDLTQVYDRLAYHYSRTDRVEKAVTYLTRFAERAARAGAHDQAIAALDEALGHVSRGPEASRERRRFDLVFRKTRSLFLLGRLKEVIDLLLPEQALVDTAADPRMAGAYYFRLGATYNYLGDYARAVTNATRALNEAGSCADFATMGKAHFLLAFDCFWKRPEEGVQHGEQAVELLEQAQERWWLGQSYWVLGLNLSYRGRFAAALEMEERARSLGESMGDRRLTSSAAWASGFVSTLAGDWESAVEACRKGVALAPDPLSRMTALGMLALAHVERGEPGDAIPLLDEAIPQAERFRFAQLHGLYLGFRGEASLQAGNPAAAVEFARRGAELTSKSGYIYGLGWTQRILGRIARASGDLALAGTHLQQCIETFDAMGAPFEMGRAHLELAELLDADSNPADARSHAQTALAIFESLRLDRFASKTREVLARLDDGPGVDLS